MSILPTTIQKPAPRKKTTPPPGDTPGTPFRDLTPIGSTETLPPAKSREYHREATPKLTVPRVPLVMQFANRCGVNLYPHYRDWEAACHKRPTPTVGCACATKQDSGGAA